MRAISKLREMELPMLRNMIIMSKVIGLESNIEDRSNKEGSPLRRG